MPADENPFIHLRALPFQSAASGFKSLPRRERPGAGENRGAVQKSNFSPAVSAKLFAVCPVSPLKPIASWKLNWPM